MIRKFVKSCAWSYAKNEFPRLFYEQLLFCKINKLYAWFFSGFEYPKERLEIVT